MKTLHTPGPWFAIQYANQWNIQSKDGYEGALTNVLDEDEDVNAEANARLIAAAPELLEALIMCLNLVGAAANESEPARNAWEKAKVAIAKATGGDK